MLKFRPKIPTHALMLSINAHQLIPARDSLIFKGGKKLLINLEIFISLLMLLK